MKGEPEFYGLTEAEFLSLPWDAIGVAVIFAILFAGLAWIAFGRRKP